jgi:hypothetical protein
MKQKHRNSGVTLLGTDKLVRATYKGEIFLPHVMHTVFLETRADYSWDLGLILGAGVVNGETAEIF